MSATSLTGKQFEEIIVYRLNQYRAEKWGSFHRPGVHAVTQEQFKDGTVRARLLQSLPDFQGVFGDPQREAVFDCKVCSQASFDLNKYRLDTKGARTRQLKFMFERAEFGSLCFFLIHWNERRLKTKAVEAATYVVPVRSDIDFWRAFEIGEERGMSRSQCVDYGHRIDWIAEGREKTLRPDLRAALKLLSEMPCEKNEVSERTRPAGRC
jgi:penicillin-binding protein-related factor A (putative recombinase)